ncbi:DUF1127 domain-containing protein, partial [Cribrihabitans sp. XS_ASV171]
MTQVDDMAATTDFTVSHSARTSGFGAWVDGLGTRIARYRLYRRTVNELSALSGRELADLG